MAFAITILMMIQTVFATIAMSMASRYKRKFAAEDQGIIPVAARGITEATVGK